MPSGAQWDQALRDVALWIIEAGARSDDGVAPIVQAGHPALRAVATPYDGQLSASELTALLDVMHRTMRAAPGVGLAAPQLGLPVALAVLEDPGSVSPEHAEVRERERLPYRVLVNPRYTPVGDERVGFYEGCLSVVGYQAVVARARRVRLTGSDEHGTPVDEVVSGWSARIVQHETDHLNGTLYLDRAELRSLAVTDEFGARWATEPRPTSAATALGFPLD
ncbi:peptide deformylase [Cellulomonas sp. zg-ZUI188]|uniref:Peptide deformylase n=1 Tax=Cellulomonas fengjieae TaxID=2819978 RepID=A0ABS3SCW9_9CELL|nr:peptide deformylase [Cellulomonas fengjieae]QVI65091.1 peptide deformylase [Cellulomonas fengjieae]